MRVRRFQMKDMDQTVVLYQTCFAEAPWFEVHDPEDVRKMLEQYSGEEMRLRSVVYVCEEDGRIIGGAIGFHIWYKQEVYKLISDCGTIHFSAHDAVDREPHQEI